MRDAHTGPLLSGTPCRRARAEPRQHDLSLGTAVKICTNTDLPRTQPGDTAARQREARQRERERHAALAQTTRATASSAPEIQK